MKREEKIPFLKAILSVAKTDRDTDLSELSLYQQLGMELGFGSDELAHIQTSVTGGMDGLKEYLEQIQERSTKLQLIYQIMIMACTDGKIEDSEYGQIKETTELLGVEEEKVREIEGLVKEAVELKRKRDRILEAGE